MFQKSIRNTILILIILAAYSVVANQTLASYGSFFYLVINPIFWLFLAIATTIFTNKTNENKIFNDKIFEYALVAAFINVRYIYCI